jgi:outer membrane protein
VKKVLLILVVLSTALIAQTTQKIGYVDSQVILNQLPAAIKAQGELDALVSKWNASIDSMVTDLQSQYTNYQQQAESMTPDARRAKWRILQKK